MIYHLYKKKVKLGGIETHIRNSISIMETRGYKSEWIERLSEIPAQKESVRVIFHGTSPHTIKAIFISLFLFNIDRHWFPHFHPPIHTNRPVLYGIYLRLVGLLLLPIKIKGAFYTMNEREEFSKYFKLYLMKIIPIGLVYGLNKKANQDLKKRQLAKLNYDFSFVARNDKVKDIDLFISIAKIFPEKKFALVSENNFAIPKNVDLFSNLRVDELKKLLISSRFFLSTSRYESLGLAIAEAEKLGVPAILRSNTGYLQINGMFELLGTPLVFDTLDELEGIIAKLNNIEDHVLFNEDCILALQRRSYNVSFEKNIDNLFLFLDLKE